MPSQPTTTATKKSSNVSFVKVEDLEFNTKNNATTIKNWDRVLDVRGVPPLDYVVGHVPGAVHLSEQTLRGPYQGRLPFQLWPADLLAHQLSNAGVKSDGSVLVYSDGPNVLGATLAAYALEKSGVPRVGVLDGGFAAFNSSSNRDKVTKAFPRFEQTKFEPKTVDGLSISLEELVKLLPQVGKQASNDSSLSEGGEKKKAVVIVDPRPKALYEGTSDSTFIRPGHIPGAINLPWQSVTEADNANAPGGKNPHRLKPEAELRRLFESRGVTPDKTVVVSCSTGRESTLQFLVLRHVLSYPDVRLYEGSWAEWSAAEGTPAEVGPDRSAPSAVGAVSS